MPLLHRLGLAQKFFIPGVLALLMILVSTGLYLKTVLSEVAVAQTESAASGAVTALNHVVQFIQTHRGMSAGALNGNESLAARRPAMRDKLTQAINELDTELNKAGSSAQLKMQWNEFRQRWSALEQGVSNKQLKSTESTKLHTQLIASLLAINDELLSEFSLALDPQADTYYLIQASLVNMPLLAENMGIMRAQGTTLVNRAGATMAEVVNSIRRVTDIMADISVASNEQSLGVSQVGEAVAQMDQATQQNAALVEQMAAAASSLKSQAGELVHTVAVFKLQG